MFCFYVHWVGVARFRGDVKVFLLSLRDKTAPFVVEYHRGNMTNVANIKLRRRGADTVTSPS
jgi:hypothetical protein